MELTRQFTVLHEMATRCGIRAASRKRYGTILLWSMSALASLWLTSTNASGEVYRLPLDQQIDIGLGDAINHPISPLLTFVSEPGGGFARMNLTAANGQGGYYWGPFISLPKAGIPYVDLSDPRSMVEFDARYFQSPSTNTNPYADAPVFALLWDASDKIVATHAHYWQAYEWRRISFFPASYQWFWGDPTVDLSRITRVGFYGTNWAGTGDDHVDFRNITLTAVPEIDPAGVGSVLALVTGSLSLLERRRKRYV